MTLQRSSQLTANALKLFTLSFAFHRFIQRESLWWISTNQLIWLMYVMMLYSCVDCIHKDFVLFSEEKGTCLVTLYETPYLALLCTLYGLEMSLPMETGNLVQNYDIIFFILWSQQTLYFLFCRLHQTAEWHCEMIATCFIRYFLTRCVFCKKNSLWILGEYVHSVHLLYAFVSSSRRVLSVCSTHSVSSLKPSFLFYALIFWERWTECLF